MSKQTFGKTLLSHFLGFLKDQVDNDRLSLEDFQSIVNAVTKDLSLSGTSDDIARYFHRSPVAVRSVICRKMLKKPRRQVVHDFLEFLKIAPESWFGPVARK